ncbi:hypothetical protein GJ496_008108 [Pomphorhynchus laevis]|nr:hypothetical protein GJ496_008108 [Pomphorhynchus laevis]
MDSNHDSSSDDQSKLFVGGLGWNTTKEQVQEYFERFGPVSDVIVLRNPATGQSRGFGFVSFTNRESSQNACNMKSGHMVDGKEVDVKPYSSKIHELKRRQKFDNSMKIFIGGIPPGMKDEDIIDAFKKFGPVIDFTNMMDETRTRSRGFGFLTFEKPESIQRSLTEHWVTINGKQLEVKPAQFNAKRNTQQADLTAAYSPYNAAAAAMSGYAAIPPYMPYYDPYSAGVMPPVPSTGGEEDYYSNPWAMPADPTAGWNQQGYDQQRWQHRQSYPVDYNAGATGYGQTASDPAAAAGMMMPPQGMPADGMMEDCGYMTEEDPYAMYQRQSGGGAPGARYQQTAHQLAGGYSQSGPRFQQPSSGASSYKYPSNNGGDR